MGVFSQLLRDESLVDVTLACSEGQSIRAHKVVLSACSSYFQTLFVDHPSRHPIVILKDVRFSELRTLIEFMYKGEVNVEYGQLSALLKTAESLKVKGLAEMTRDYKQEPEQTEPEELVGRRTSTLNQPSTQPLLQQPPAQPPTTPSTIQQQPQQQQPQALVQQPRPSSAPRPPPSPDEIEAQDSPSSVQNLRVCRSPLPALPPSSSSSLLERDRDRDRSMLLERGDSRESIRRPSSVEDVSPPVSSDCGASDMSIHNNSNSMVGGGGGCSTTPINNPAPICSRLPSPNCEPLPGPSNMPPVQQVPLSLKKEVDWGGGIDDKNAGESSSEYSRHPHDSAMSEPDRCIGSPVLDRPSSTQSSRSSTPFTLPFPTLPTALLEVGLMHPSLLGDEMFRCSSCMAAFPSLWLLEQHTALQHIGSISSIDKPFVCEQCGQSYRYRSAYVKHREQNHRARLPADKLFSCDVCGMQFRYLKSFKKHRLNHALEKLHGKSGENRELQRGSSGASLAGVLTGSGGGGGGGGIGSGAGHSSDGENKESSRGIVENSSDQVSSSNETLTVEEDSPIVVKKETDDAMAVEGGGTSSDAEKTEAEQDDTIDSMAAFSFPNTTTPTSDLLMRSAHENSIINFLRADTAERQRERRFACPFCGKCVRSKENLKLHVRKHTGERPFVCLFCGRAFGGKSDLTRHLRIHTGERPYHCDMCGKCFARADYLSKHLTTHINTPR